MLENVKIVADSSADFLSLDGIDFASAPLKILSPDKEYVDDENLDVANMVQELSDLKGHVSTACPSPGEWLEAFGEAEIIFAVAISSGLSGSYNSLLSAKSIYESEHPGRVVYCIDSINAGPGEQLIVYKVLELLKQGVDPKEIYATAEEYKHHLGILFLLQSVHNFANNGRVNPLLAKVIGFLNIKMLGRNGETGKIEIAGKARGNKKGIALLMEHAEKMHLKNSRIIIGHVYNEEMAQHVAGLLKEAYPGVDIIIYQLRGLCSFYAENQGLLVAFEKDE